MVKIISVFLFLLAMLACMGSLCDISSHNGMKWDNGDGRIDTTHIQKLDSSIMVTILVNIREFDYESYKHKPVFGAEIHFYNEDVIKQTDSVGNATSTFLIDSLPYKYSYEVTKEGYKKFFGSGWDTVQIIQHTLSIDKEK